MSSKRRQSSIQEYLDEAPIWEDGTPVTTPLLTSLQWWIWVLAASGKFFEGKVVFLTGVALPLLTQEFQLSQVEKGMIGSATLFGILVGALTLGDLSDRFGRKRMFIIEMLLFIGFLIALCLAGNVSVLIACLFGLGLALGCDYPTAHLIVSECTSSQVRGRLVLGAFAFQALGALFGTVVGYAVLSLNPELSAWRLMYAVAIIPAAIATIGRFFIPESPHWLYRNGRVEESEAALGKLLRRQPPYPKSVNLHPQAEEVGVSSQAGLFSKKHRRATALASIPWFLQDLSTYGIGIFTPTILAATFGQEVHAHSVASLIQSTEQAAKGAAFLDILLIVGIIGAVLLTDKVGRIKLQVWGFIGCALGLTMAACSNALPPSAAMPMLFAGFMLFNFMTNVGPNAQTYLLAGEVFPLGIRGRGAGFAAAVGKVGAVLTSFLFPILLKDLGVSLLLALLIAASLLGAVVTHVLRIETRGRSLEDLG